VPELPEVETIRRDLADRLVGRRITSVVATGARSVRRYRDPVAFVEELQGAHVASLDRHGKYLLIRLNDQRVLVVHLRMSGQLLWHANSRDPLLPHSHVVLGLDNKAQLRFVDPRTFGELFVTTEDLPELAHFGPDALAASAESAQFAAALRLRRTMIKSLLLDQRFVAGIGNIYSDEILFAAGVRYDRPGTSLRRIDATRIAEATHAILTNAVEARGSSLGDAQYVDTSGVGGSFQLQHHTYGREGQGCTTCGRPIVRTAFGGRSTFWCRRCQR
jgi:formamidopyrimidine-DNA glycosylase